MQFAAAKDLEGVRRSGLFHTDADVRLQFLVEPLAQVAAGHKLTLAASERRVVHAELDGDGRFIDHDRRQRLRILQAGDRLADGEAAYTRDRDDVAHGRLFDVRALQAAEAEQFGDLYRLQRAVQLSDVHGLARLQRSVKDACDAQAAQVVAVVQVRHQHLQRPIHFARGGWNRAHNRLEQGKEVLTRYGHVQRCRAGLAVRVHHREVELVFGRVQVDEQVIDLVQHFLYARVRAVDLVDHKNRRQLCRQRL